MTLRDAFANMLNIYEEKYLIELTFKITGTETLWSEVRPLAHSVFNVGPLHYRVRCNWYELGQCFYIQ